MSFTPSRPHPRSHWKKLTQLALSYFIPLGGAQNLTKTVLIYGDCHQNCPSCGTGRCRPRRRMDSAHPATGGCASPRCGRRLSYFSDIVCLLLSNVCVVTSFYQSLQAMSSFALFSICASYCTLSAKGRHLKESYCSPRWRSIFTAYSILPGLSREAAFQPMLCQFHSVAARFAGLRANIGTEPSRFPLPFPSGCRSRRWPARRRLYWQTASSSCPSQRA